GGARLASASAGALPRPKFWNSRSKVPIDRTGGRKLPVNLAEINGFPPAAHSYAILLISARPLRRARRKVDPARAQSLQFKCHLPKPMAHCASPISLSRMVG